MLLFNYRATSAAGQPVTSRVQAESAAAALATLQQQGLRDVQLMDDEHSAIDLKNAESAQRLHLSPADELAMRRQPTMGRRLGWILRKNAWIWAPLLAWTLYASWSAGWALPAWPLALLCTFMIWFAWATLPSVMYQHALDASAWCRWAEVEHWMRWLARWKAWFRFPFPDHELAFRTATARAGQGHLREALKLVAPLANDASLAPGFYPTRLSSLYAAAHQFDKVAELQQEAQRLNPSATSALDLAVTRVRWLGDAPGAQQLLEGIDPAPLPPMAQAFYHYGAGLVALAQGRADAALEHLDQALALAMQFLGISPLIQALLLDARAHCGLALVALGRRSEARPHFEAAYPMLKARGDAALINRCKAAYRAAQHPG